MADTILVFLGLGVMFYLNIISSRLEDITDAIEDLKEERK